MEYSVPELGEGVFEAEFVEWLVRPGELVRHGQNLAEVMTDKATMELPSPFVGTVETLAVEPGQTIEVGQVLLRYSSPADPIRRPATRSVDALDEVEHQQDPTDGVELQGPIDPGSRSSQASGVDDGQRTPRVQAAPAVRQMARSLGIDLGQVPGNGPHGRVLINDLGSYVKRQQKTTSKERRKSTLPDLGTPGTRVKMRGVRRSIAEHMVLSTQTIPHFTYVEECDVSEMVALRGSLKRSFYRQKIKLTYVPFYVKAVAVALRKVPLVNASLDEENGEIVLHDRYHVGLAMASNKGLIVPVIRDVDRLSIADIAREIERLREAVRNGAISREELRGSTFTLSSIGNVGGLISTPIIHHPEVGILSVGRVFKRPVFNEANEVVPARIAYLSFSFDHRVVDGSVGAIFGNAVIDRLENPENLMDPS